MRVADGRSAAREWVTEHVAGQGDFRGAFFTGSAAAATDDEVLPPTSDVDVTVLLATDAAPPKLGKVCADGVLLDITFLPFDAVADADAVAGNYYLAPSFRHGQLIADPTGRLRAVQDRIAPRFAAPDEVWRRSEHVFGLMTSRLGALNTSLSWHELVMSWMFPTSLATQVVLVAARRAPTVRRRYLAAGAVLTALDHADYYATLLRQLGCADCDPVTVQRHLDELAVVFDEAAAVARTPFFFSSDVTVEARPISIDGSQDLIDSGDHREAVFWVVATFARCLQILDADAPPRYQRADALFRHAVEELLGLVTPTELLARRDMVQVELPMLRRTAAHLETATE
ncbi:MAG: hypothetical protein ACR2KJ_19185 [Jatrophihabitans sp.]